MPIALFHYEMLVAIYGEAMTRMFFRPVSITGRKIHADH